MILYTLLDPMPFLAAQAALYHFVQNLISAPAGDVVHCTYMAWAMISAVVVAACLEVCLLCLVSLKSEAS